MYSITVVTHVPGRAGMIGSWHWLNECGLVDSYHRKQGQRSAETAKEWRCVHRGGLEHDLHPGEGRLLRVEGEMVPFEFDAVMSDIDRQP